MKFFSSNEEAINAAIQLLNTYPNLHRVINDDNLATSWLEHLKKKSEDVNNLLIEPSRVITVLTLSMMVAFIRQRGTSNKFTIPFEGMLTSLDRALGALKESDNLDCFRHKLRNPEGTQTISCFSELFLAEHFHKKGFRVSFEYPFQVEFPDEAPENPDFDIALFLNGKSFFIEVYTPISVHNGSEIETGFPGDSYPDFLARIRHKVSKKFGFERNGIIKAPNFPKILAINARYYDSVSVELALDLTAKQLIKDLRSMFSGIFPLDAVIIFQINDTHPAMPIQFHHVEFNERATQLEHL